MKRRVTKPAAKIDLAELGDKPEEVHVFDDESVWAINAALAARRPLLVRGEPGVGKSQLARAAAAPEMLNCPLVPFVVDSGTESRDLLWTFDAVKRLAEAQVAGALREDGDAVTDRLHVDKFFHPGPLWWAFDWITANAQAELVGAAIPKTPDKGWEPGQGCVVLIDEIDKAESDVPNGLLEALGSGTFQPQGRELPVTVEDNPPLVVITTNGERVLPDAFMRRCLVLDIVLPSKPDELKTLLIERGRAHFAEASDAVLTSAAEMLVKDRFNTQFTPRPGQAEYLDLLRIVTELCPGDSAQQEKTLERVAAFVLDKKPIGGE